MLELMKKLFGAEATEQKLKQVQELLETGYVPMEDFQQLQEELKRLQEEHALELDALEKRAEAEQFSMALEHALTAAGARNVKAVQALLSMEGLRLEDGQIMGLAEQLKALKEESGYLFTDGRGNVQFVRPSGVSKAGITLEDFQEMGYMDRLKLKKEQPELYRELMRKTGGKLCRLI